MPISTFTASPNPIIGPGNRAVEEPKINNSLDNINNYLSALKTGGVGNVDINAQAVRSTQLRPFRRFSKGGGNTTFAANLVEYEIIKITSTPPFASAALSLWSVLGLHKLSGASGTHVVQNRIQWKPTSGGVWTTLGGADGSLVQANDGIDNYTSLAANHFDSTTIFGTASVDIRLVGITLNGGGQVESLGGTSSLAIEWTNGFE